MRGMSSADATALGGLEHLRQSVIDILGTRIGTRVMRRDYGSDLPNLIDRPINDELTIELFAATATALDRWEPRLRLDEIRVVSAAPGRVELAMQATYLPDGRLIRLDGIIIS